VFERKMDIVWRRARVAAAGVYGYGSLCLFAWVEGGWGGSGGEGARGALRRDWLTRPVHMHTLLNCLNPPPFPGNTREGDC
jgi:hypothetical protein